MNPGRHRLAACLLLAAAGLASASPAIGLAAGTDDPASSGAAGSPPSPPPPAQAPAPPQATADQPSAPVTQPAPEAPAKEAPAQAAPASPDTSTPPPSPPPPPPPPPPAKETPQPPKNLEPIPKPEVISVLGKKVKGPAGEDMGRVVDLLLDRDARPKAVVIDFGGFLGVGSRKIAIDWRLVRFVPDDPDAPITLGLGKADVQAAPEYKDTAQPPVMVGPPPSGPDAAR